MRNDEIMKKTISYIEENLYVPLSLDMIASNVYLSVPQLYRIFNAYSFMSIKQYIRFRRVSDGAQMIKNSDETILDIALSLGFESHEVFIRAFKKVYGISPSKIKHNTSIELVEAFDVMKHKKQIESEVIKLEVPIVEFKEINLQVVSKKLNQKEQNDNQLIPKFINEFRKSIENNPNVKYTKLYSLYEYDVSVLKEDDENINYIYYLGLEHSVKITGFDPITIPKNKYAEFIYDIKQETINGVELSTFTLLGEPITDIYDYIDGVWLVTSGYQLSGDMDFEIRDKENPNIIKHYISIL